MCKACRIRATVTPNPVTIKGDMAFIHISHKGKQVDVVIDASDLPVAGQYRWCVCDRNGHKTVMCSRYVNKRQRTLILPRVLLGIENPSILIDHIDRDGLNNRRSNLRLADSSINGQNRNPRARNSSGYRGVSADGHGFWVARVMIAKQVHRLGRFRDKEEAIKAVVAFRSSYVPYSPEAHATSGSH